MESLRIIVDGTGDEIYAKNAKRRTYASLSVAARAELLIKQREATAVLSSQRSPQEENEARKAARVRKAKSIAAELQDHRSDRLEERRQASQEYRPVRLSRSEMMKRKAPQCKELSTFHKELCFLLRAKLSALRRMRRSNRREELMD